MNDLEHIARIIEPLGFTLETEQLHVGGERVLMSKHKLVLIARRNTDAKRVVIKASDEPVGKKDIAQEKQARDLLKSVNFANRAIAFPQELYFGEHQDYLLWIIEFIEQEKVFVEHNLEEQFFLALSAFEAQESFHATTYEHLGKVKKIFPVLYAREYFEEFAKFIESSKDSEVKETLSKGLELMQSNKALIDKYCNYLTHTDFVPMNFRVRDRQLYMLDCAPEVRTVHFGNKYEGWARFLNYMVIHNPKLEAILADYVRQNRGDEDHLALRLMRGYKIGFLIDFYDSSIEKTGGDLKSLTQERIDFWHEILKYILKDEPIPGGFVEEYKQKRDKLRSEEEKRRQREFAIA